MFGSDDEEEDAEKEALAAKRLEEYRAKKALKPKTSMFKFRNAAKLWAGSDESETAVIVDLLLLHRTSANILTNSCQVHCHSGC